jgi:hypothetical protein
VSARAALRLAIALCISTACVVVETRRPNSPPPPPPQGEYANTCAEGAAYRPGEYRWNGQTYEWVGGQCVVQPGYRWQEGVWYPCDDAWCHREGSWILIGGAATVSKP